MNGQRVTEVTPHSPAARAGVQPGDFLLSVNGEPVLDLVDYLDLTAGSALTLELADSDGTVRQVSVRKTETEPLGLGFESSLMSPMRSCRNKCRFCFIDQMPKGVRLSLRVKDDDWRLSFIMGNYVSLTNVDDAEFARLLRRGAGPLFVSVHATDPAVRVNLMGNPEAGRLMERLTALRDANITFHAQIVLCPGLNDGEILLRSLNDLFALHPVCASVAVVPVGLTKFREGLYPLRPYTVEESGQVIDAVEAWVDSRFQNPPNKPPVCWVDTVHCPLQSGTRFAFLADEWYLVAGRPLPPCEDYEDFPQIENGVGLLRLFEEEFLAALADNSEILESGIWNLESPHYSIAGGTLAAPFFRDLLGRALAGSGITIHQYAIENRYFGGNVHVTGLITGADLVEQLKGKPMGQALLIPGNMLREGEDVFLDGMRLAEVSEKLGVPVYPFADGEGLVKLLYSR